MPSAKYVGYLSGVAVAAGVGAALAVAGQGTAYAETDGASSSSSSSDSSDSGSTSGTSGTTAATSESKDEGVDAGPKRGGGYDEARTVRELKKRFGTANSTASEDDTDDTADEPADDSDTGLDVTDDTDDTDADPTEDADLTEDTEEAPEPEEAATEPEAEPQTPDDVAPQAVAALAALAAPADDDEETPAAPSAAAAATVDPEPVPWSPNPFRPMPPEPAPYDMPGVLWNIEQNILNAFDPAPFLKPFVREGYEAGFRFSQMIPWVNVVIPVANIAGEVPNLLSGDPVLFRDATQSMINNLLVTIHPVSVLFYGYDEIADLINLEYEAQQLKDWFYTTTWDILDPFALLHNRGESGLPLSPSSPSQTLDTSEEPEITAPVQLAAATVDVAETTDDPGSSPLRTSDPDPIGMPYALIQTRDLVGSFLPPALRPVSREGIELMYRVSQIVPFVNAAIPTTEILPALFLAFGGNKTGAQIAINQLLLTTPQVSFAYYVYDQIADWLNVEETAFAAKEQLYSELWDTLDPNFFLHNQGDSGLLTA
ncbi:MAG: hypothetical protein SW019_02130 [Actinomycetota bacterium]|nr:hypothetical protein [Actinomycetota bacterium]